MTHFFTYYSQETEHSWLPPLPETVEPGDQAQTRKHERPPQTESGKISPSLLICM